MSAVSIWVKRALYILRFSAVLIVLLLLLDPFIKSSDKKIESPVIIIAQDNSESILSSDSLYYKTVYKEKLDKLVADLRESYEVNTYSFGTNVTEGIEYRFDDKETSISNLIDELENKFENRNVGAVIIASDGLFNKGSNPVYSSNGIQAPIYTITLGDTIVKKDLILDNVKCNRLVYLGNQFPVEVSISSFKCAGEAYTLFIHKQGKEVFKQEITVDPKRSLEKVTAILKAEADGIQHYVVSVSHLIEEVTYVNNRQDVYIDVLDSKQRVLILGNAPHPDLSAIKNSIESNDNYEAELIYMKDFNGEVKDYGLVILHDLPSKRYNTEILARKMLDQNIPVLYIIGANTSIATFNKSQSLVSVVNSSSALNNSQSVLNENFGLFALSNSGTQQLAGLPPLACRFGTYKIGPHAQILFKQQIGSVASDYPLFVYGDLNGARSAVITGEGLFRWRMYEYKEYGNQNGFDELLNKTVQYLSVKVKRDRLRVTTKTSYDENEAVSFKVEMYNEIYEPVLGEDVQIDVYDAENNKYEYVFSPNEAGNILKAGVFDYGSYRFEASSKIGNSVYSSKGQFVVNPIVAEKMRNIADVKLMYNLALENGGEMFYESELEKVLDIINAREDIKSYSSLEYTFQRIINQKWIYFIILALLGAEWLIRKRSGAY
ncbi:MAG: hypothetical protein HRT72_10035 [Flavobacteriales bacterium]|nr:hypothetical protein [Flavobacteriales bacterium]